ncbi:pyridoxal phosphate-dependent decarboxylase family protein [Fulvivirga lutimaris]|uniref:pyridoxal phosphate-dependent decarboxylase family protein n=1 Tax=Fulvivirga lutimaris TaxID=1819566 RepID=UPI0012BC050B|nr:pyridoxal-dependent decarboxylase [Fulvivirga lutimaris]MTI39629.1 aspartate aminotransferase family protein [Fulvivirga lutimaris]
MTKVRKSPLEMEKDEFRKVGYKLIDDISDFISTIDQKPVTPGEKPSQLQKLLENRTLPENGTSAELLLSKATELLLNHSLLNGHPKFFGYITSSAAPIGALADLLAASVNPNVGAHILSPIATEIEKQTMAWLAEFIGVSPNYGGILVSGGNMANFTGFLAGRTAMASEKLKTDGLNATEKLTIYCSKTTHTWIEKAAILFGSGLSSIRWIKTNTANQMDTAALEETIKADLSKGFKPIMIIGTAGDVSTGTVDDLKNLAAISKKLKLWFHIDGAYGIPAAVLPSCKTLFEGLEEADSIALDPHKWLYSPLEAGCTLVKNPKHLTDTYSSHPDYYNFGSHEGEYTQNFYEFGLQNSRGFKALKVWLMLQQIGKNGYIKLISEDIELAQLLFELANRHEDLEALTQNLSITTLRYVPKDFDVNQDNANDYLNKLNEELLNKLQLGGELFLSNAVIQDKYCLRACIVNFRTSEKDIHEIIDIISREGDKTHKSLSKTN